ncbi:hypothetical protein [Nocardia sp. NPDC050435]|uniref:hypothetical protein n=1 Tax=Nocardia sp. NPDC050435 TaxID=3155040 RepID=UPI0033EBAF9E
MDRTAVYGRGDIEAMMDAVDVDSMSLASAGIDPIQIWYTHAGSEPNPLSEPILTALGHRDPDGWMGPIVLTTRGDPKWVCQPFAEDVRARVDEVVIAAGGTVTSAPAVDATARADPMRALGNDPDPAEGTESGQKPTEIAAAIGAALSGAASDQVQLDYPAPDITQPGTDPTTLGPDLA